VKSAVPPGRVNNYERNPGVETPGYYQASSGGCLAPIPMSQIAGTSSYIYFETDIFPGLAITEESPGLYATAYGMLADFVRAVTPYSSTASS
jgi:hypothetical protein